MRATRAAASAATVLLRAGDAGARDGINKTSGVRGDGLKSRVGTGGRGKKNGRETDAIHFDEVICGFLDNHVGGEHAVYAGSLCIVGKFGQTVAKDGIEITEDDEAGSGTRGTNFAREGENVLEPRAARECALAGALDDGAIGKRIAERHAELDHVGARIDGRDGDFARGVETKGRRPSGR